KFQLRHQMKFMKNINHQLLTLIFDNSLEKFIVKF
ncbi:IgA-specific serine endopeptidase autotransporter precursor, partial [Haemophilus influenzae]